MANAQKTGAAMLLAKQLKLMQTTEHIPGISVGLVDDGDVFEWEVMLMINDECKFYGGESVFLFFGVGGRGCWEEEGGGERRGSREEEEEGDRRMRGMKRRRRT